MEAGVNKYLQQSVKYTPFKLFYNIFSRSNPKLMDQVRGTVRNDIYNILANIPAFKFENFIAANEVQHKGKRLLQISHNIGIYLLKKKLNVRSAFKVVTNYHMRNQVYGYILTAIERSAAKVNQE